MSRELMIFSGNANLALAQEICAYLGVKLGEATVSMKAAVSGGYSTSWSR